MSIPLTNEDLLRLNRGDRNAFNAFYTFFYPKLFTTADGIVKNSMEAEDIALETLTKLWKHHHRFDTISHLTSFLYITTRNACFTYLKKKKAEQSLHKGMAYVLEQVDQHEIDRAFIKAELLEAIDEKIEQLPDDCRDIFKMMWFDGKRGNEIAKELNLSEDVVSDRKKKAIRILGSAPFTNRFLLLLYAIFYMLFKK